MINLTTNRYLDIMNPSNNLSTPLSDNCDIDKLTQNVLQNVLNSVPIKHIILRNGQIDVKFCLEWINNSPIDSDTMDRLLSHCHYTDTGVYCNKKSADGIGLCQNHYNEYQAGTSNISIPDMILHKINQCKAVIDFLSGCTITQVSGVRAVARNYADHNQIMLCMNQFRSRCEKLKALLPDEFTDQ